MRYVSRSGTRIVRSESGISAPPLSPVNAMVKSPLARAVSAAAQTFRAFPEVLMPTKTSPFFPNAQTTWAKTSSDMMSFAKALLNAGNPVSGITGRAFWSCSDKSSGNFDLSSTDRGRFLQNPLSNSPAQWSASVALPPLPHTSTFADVL